MREGMHAARPVEMPCTHVGGRYVLVGSLYTAVIKPSLHAAVRRMYTVTATA